MKFSKQRNIIYDTVCKNAIHPTADQVYAQIKADNPNLSLGTVYRNLNLLADVGQLRKIPVPNGSDRFDGRLDEHFHIICENCGKVADVELSVQDEFKEFVADDTGYEVSTFDVVFKGTCPKCKIKT